VNLFFVCYSRYIFKIGYKIGYNKKKKEEELKTKEKKNV